MPDEVIVKKEEAGETVECLQAKLNAEVASKNAEIERNKEFMRKFTADSAEKAQLLLENENLKKGIQQDKTEFEEALNQTGLSPEKIKKFLIDPLVNPLQEQITQLTGRVEGNMIMADNPELKDPAKAKEVLDFLRNNGVTPTPWTIKNATKELYGKSQAQIEQDAEAKIVKRFAERGIDLPDTSNSNPEPKTSKDLAKDIVNAGKKEIF
jgi:hypothetical protein